MLCYVSCMMSSDRLHKAGCAVLCVMYDEF